VSNVRKTVLAGAGAVLPVVATVAAIDFLLEMMASIFSPALQPLTELIHRHYPQLERLLQLPWIQGLLAILISIAGLYLIGLLVQRVIGRRLMGLVESGISYLPLVKTVYGLIKQFLESLNTGPSGNQRVVLIPFPTPEMKTVGLVTRTFQEDATGRELAAVYVPTTPNPTSGYLEIVPVEQLVNTGWTVDEAMQFIISGGSVAPAQIVYDHPAHPSSAAP
jgi:uncharacterized membrane protein